MNMIVKGYTFAQLEDKNLNELHEILQTTRASLHNLRQQRFAKIGQILFYQDQIEAERLGQLSGGNTALLQQETEK